MGDPRGTTGKRVVKVRDHVLLRKGIAALVNAESDMKLVAEASNGQEAIEKFRRHRPDMTLMDPVSITINGMVGTGVLVKAETHRREHVDGSTWIYLRSTDARIKVASAVEKILGVHS